MTVEEVAVIGFGTMGTGIAQLLAQTGFSVWVVDLDEEILQRGLELVKTGRFGLERAVQRGKLKPAEAEEAIRRMKTTTNLEEAVKRADYVIENVFEDMELKKQVFSQLDSICPPDTILASDTSVMSITEIASAVHRPERVVGMHFFNPAQVMKLVEVIRGVLTSQKTVDLTVELTRRVGKTPILVKDTPGFAAARLGLVQFLEASKILDEGVASVADVDTAMKLGFGHPMGPFELSDLIGLDVRLDILRSIYEATGDPAWKPPWLLRQLVSSGYVGDPKFKKGSRGGYYDYFNLSREG
ncbi:MAG: 3-hydroxyacyl-CoA dehydrogenase family protein [Candidatus Geothermarchaeales archaeon]